MNTLEKAARDYARIKPDVFIDSEERYYNGHACENYDTFKAGAKWAIDTIFNWRNAGLWFRNATRRTSNRMYRKNAKRI